MNNTLTLPDVDPQLDTFLPPIEKPKGLIMKLAYYFTRRQFGKVLTPIKVHSARLPSAFGMFYSKIGRLDKKLSLPGETVMLVREQVARTNVCLFCIDIGRAFTIQKSMNQAKFDALEQYRTSPLFNDGERDALDYVTALTKDRKVDPATFCPAVPLLLRARDLRDRLACRQRTPVQHDKHRFEHPFGHAL